MAPMTADMSGASHGGARGGCSEIVIAIRSERSMRKLGMTLGRLVQAGDFIGLIGDLGAGKTVLTRGIAEGAEVPADQVASPTFAIVYPYQGRILLHHADLYRLADEEELYATGFYDLLPRGATIVEWIDQVPEAMPADRLLIRIERSGPRSRRVRLEPEGPRATTLAHALAEEFRS